MLSSGLTTISFTLCLPIYLSIFHLCLPIYLSLCLYFCLPFLLSLLLSFILTIFFISLVLVSADLLIFSFSLSFFLILIVIFFLFYFLCLFLCLFLSSSRLQTWNAFAYLADSCKKKYARIHRQSHAILTVQLLLFTLLHQTERTMQFLQSLFTRHLSCLAYSGPSLISWL